MISSYNGSNRQGGSKYVIIFEERKNNAPLYILVLWIIKEENMHMIMSQRELLLMHAVWVDGHKILTPISHSDGHPNNFDSYLLNNMLWGSIF